MSNRSFTDLNVYKECRKFRKEVSKVIKAHFPKVEKYLLTAQLLDSSRSITANIAEGHGRFYYLENVKFCRYSRASLEESLEHLITAFDEKYISLEILKDLKNKHDTCLKLLNGYIKYLNKAKAGEKVEKDSNIKSD